MKTILILIFFIAINYLTFAQASGHLAPVRGSADHNDYHNLEPKGILDDQTILNLTIVTGSLTNTKLVATYFSTFGFLTITDQTKVHLKLHGTVAQFSQVFNTTFVEYHCEDNYNKMCFATTSEVYLPASLHSAIVGILGLEQVLKQKPHWRGEPRRAPRAAASYFLGSQAAQVYGVPASTGAGIKVGIITLGGYFKQSELNTFFSSNGLGTAPTINIVYVDGATQTLSDSNTAVENYLDVEIIASVVPQATITFYFGPNTGQGFYDVFNQAILNNNIVSASWGSAEYGNPGSYMNSFQTLFSTYSNVPVFIATGDDGAYISPSTTAISAGFPSSCPNAIGKKKGKNYFLKFF